MTSNKIAVSRQWCFRADNITISLRLESKSAMFNASIDRLVLRFSFIKWYTSLQDWFLGKLDSYFSFCSASGNIEVLGETKLVISSVPVNRCLKTFCWLYEKKNIIKASNILNDLLWMQYITSHYLPCPISKCFPLSLACHLYLLYCIFVFK